MADIFDVIADPTRRDVLQTLLDRAASSDSGEMRVGEIVSALGLSQPTVSKHLKVLRDIGLVAVRESGQHRYYSLDVSPLEDLEDWLIPFLSLGFDPSEDELAVGVFSAWAGDSIRVPLRRAARLVQNPAETGTSIGRALAEGGHQARRVRSAVQDASNRVTQRVREAVQRLKASDRDPSVDSE